MSESDQKHYSSAFRRRPTLLVVYNPKSQTARIRQVTGILAERARQILRNPTSLTNALLAPPTLNDALPRVGGH